MDPRLASKPYVVATKVPLNERFLKVQSHNPLRPNPEFKLAASVKEDPVSRNPRLAGLGEVNKLAVLRASKDAEILRLKTQLQNLGGGTSGDGGGLLTSIQKNRGGGLIFKNRVGGGMYAGRRGGKGQLEIRNKNIMSLLDPEISFPGDGISPLKRNLKGNANSSGSNRRGFKQICSKEGLDDELDSYMSKSKSKARTTLDNELDQYMEAARAAKLLRASKEKETCEETHGAAMQSGEEVQIVQILEPLNQNDEEQGDLQIDEMETW